MGPTAAGKTDAAVSLVRELSAELISVDSALVYRGLDIGTAKPDSDLLQQAPHRLVNLREPHDPYSAADFLDDAVAEIQQIHSQGHLPVLVGGTMMYFHVLEHGIAQMPGADPEIRQRLDQLAAERGWAHLHERLTAVDPHSAAKIHPNDPQRIQRALEVWELTGRPISQIQKASSVPPLELKILKLALSPKNRETLHRRIEARFDVMLEAGFMEEMKGLFEAPQMSPDLPSMRSVGYRQGWQYLAGECDLIEMRRRVIVATRQLAKRQLTWLRRQPDVVWVDSEENGAVERILELVTAFSSAGN